MKKRLSIIIVNWNAEIFLEKCLLSIQNYHSPFQQEEMETIVFDNASRPGSVDPLIEKFRWVKWIINDENLGFAKANNLALEQSSGEYILFLNPDTELIPLAIERLFRSLEAHKEIGIVGPRLLNSDGTLQESCYPFPSVWKEAWRLFFFDSLVAFGRYDMKKWDKTKTRRVDFVQGACMMIKKICLDQIGAFDSDFFVYSEELDLCYRFHKAGYKCYWIPQAEVIHHGGRSTRQAEKNMFLMLYKTKILFFKKQYGRVNEFLYKLIILAASIARIIAVPILNILNPNEIGLYTKRATLYRLLFQCTLLNRFP